MSDRTQRDDIELDSRKGAVGQEATFEGLYPFEAFEFDDPNVSSSPVLTLKSPWKFAASSSVLEASTDQTITDDDGYTYVMVTTGASDITITLPTAADNSGRELTVIKVDTGSGKVIVDGEGSEAVGGQTTFEIHLNGGEVKTICNGTSWYLLSTTAVPLFHIEDQKTAGTDGGTFDSGAWRTRDLNTVVTNEIPGASLSSNQFTLPAGTYEIYARATTYFVRRNMPRLQNITDGTTSLWGNSLYTYDAVMNDAIVQGRITITASKTFELQHRCAVSNPDDGFGIQINSQFTVDHETYAQVWIKKVAA